MTVRVPLTRQFQRGRPVRERRTPVNAGNRPDRDDGEGEGRLSLTLSAYS
jgi:hypothetical protein